MSKNKSFFQKLSDSITNLLPFGSNSKDIPNASDGYHDKRIASTTKSVNRRLASEAFNMDDSQVKIKRAKLHHNPMSFPTSRIIKTPVLNEISDKFSGFNNFNDTASVLSETSSVSVSTSGVSSLHPRSNKRMNLGSNILNTPVNTNSNIKYPRNLNLSYSSGQVTSVSSMKSLKENNFNGYMSSPARKILEKLNELTTPISAIHRYSTNSPYQRPLNNPPKYSKNLCRMKAVVVNNSHTNYGIGPIRRKATETNHVSHVENFDTNKKIPRFEQSLISKKLDFSNLPLLKRNQSTNTDDLCENTLNRPLDSPPLKFTFREPKLIEEMYEEALEKQTGNENAPENTEIGNKIKEHRQFNNINHDSNIEIEKKTVIKQGISETDSNETAVKIRNITVKVLEEEKFNVDKPYQFETNFNSSSLKSSSSEPVALFDLKSKSDDKKPTFTFGDVSKNSSQENMKQSFPLKSTPIISISDQQPMNILSNVSEKNTEPKTSLVFEKVPVFSSKTDEAIKINTDFSKPSKFNKIENLEQTSKSNLTSSSSLFSFEKNSNSENDKNSSERIFVLNSSSDSLTNKTVSQDFSFGNSIPKVSIAPDVSSSLFASKNNTSINAPSSLFSGKESDSSSIFATAHVNLTGEPSGIFSSNVSNSESIFKSIEPSSIFTSNNISNQSDNLFGKPNTNISVSVAASSICSSVSTNITESSQLVSASSNINNSSASISSFAFVPSTMNSFGQVQSSINQTNNLFAFGKVSNSPVLDVKTTASTQNVSFSTFQFNKPLSAGMSTNSSQMTSFVFGESGTNSGFATAEKSSSFPIINTNNSINVDSNQTAFKFGEIGKITDNSSSFQFGNINSTVNMNQNRPTTFNFGAQGKVAENSTSFQFGNVKNPEMNQNQMTPFTFGAETKMGDGLTDNKFSITVGQNTSNQRRLLKVRRNRK